jgi:hypothetical protein
MGRSVGYWHRRGRGVLVGEGRLAFATAPAVGGWCVARHGAGGKAVLPDLGLAHSGLGATTGGTGVNVPAVFHEAT